jgi:hypothetical protein
VIQINLLPPEYRAKAGTPVGRFVAIVAGVVVVASALGVFAWTHFIELARVRELRSAREEEAIGQDRRKKYSLDLQAEIDMFEKRRTAIQTINRSRTLWSRKIDQLFDLVTNQAGEAPFRAWLESIEVPAQPVTAKRRAPAAGKKGAAPDGGQLKFKGFLALEAEADAPAHISAFHRALTSDVLDPSRPGEFFQDFLRINNPNVKIVPPQGKDDDQLEPPLVGEFKYELGLTPKDLGPAAAGGAKGAKPAKAARAAAGPEKTEESAR